MPAAQDRDDKAVSPPPALSLAGFREQRLMASDGEPFDHLGYSVATTGDVVVAGARFADVVGIDSGAVYVFRRDSVTGWRGEAKLLPADPFEHDRFGNAVDLDGDTLIVGAHSHHELGRKIGSAYIFRYRRGTWRQEAKLAVPGSARFGHAVAVAGDRVAVGSLGDRIDGVPVGAVHVFRRRGASWQPEARLVAADAEEGDLFGVAVGLSGDTLVAGASADDERGSLTGAAYVFRRSAAGWRQEAKLLAQDASALAEFGKAVAIDGDTVVAGASGAGIVGKFSGAAYVFIHQDAGWRQEARLLAVDSRPADRFGNAVAIHLDTAAVGAHFADVAGLGSGATYVFRQREGRWKQEAKLVPHEAVAGEEFGNAVAVRGDTVAVGVLRGGSRGTAMGSVSVFER
jgi:hypothetical protein